jgi:hypothetical protein
MSELEVHAPEADGMGLLQFLAVQGALAKLRLQTALLAGAVGREQKAMESDAEKARALADKSAPAEVAPEYLARLGEVAGALLGVSEAAQAVVSAAEDASHAANESNEAHQGEYRGIFELAQSSRHPMAKPGFYEAK